MNNMVPPDIEGATNAVTDVAKTAHQYGIENTIIGALIVILLILVIAVFFIARKMSKRISDANDTLIKYITDKESNKVPEKDEHHKNIAKDYIETQLVFGTLCKNILGKINADRVAIYVFHNGNSTPTGLPFYKVSCIGESVLRTVDLNYRLRAHQNIPMAVFNNIIQSIYNDGYFENITDPQREFDELVQFTGTANNERLYMLGIKDSQGILLGFSVCKYLHKPIGLTIDDLREGLEELNGEIVGIISNSKIQKSFENSK